MGTTPTVTAARKEKTCPYCKEQILADAIKCKHCGTALGTVRETQM
jgi:hypothetical protein